MRNQTASFFLYALASAGLFYLVAVLHLGFLFMMLPSLPVFYVALTQNPRAMLAVSAIAAAFILPVGGVEGALFFLIFSLLPVLVIGGKALQSRESTTGRQWYPLGLAFVELVSALVLLTVVMSFYYAGAGDINETLRQNIADGTQQLEPEYRSLVLQLSSSAVFMVIAASLWMWLLLAYLHGWIAQKIARSRGRAVRPDFAVTPFAMPHWMLGAMTLAGIASLLGSPTLSFAGKVSLMLLLFPYFLLGMALIHEKSTRLPSRGFVLFMVYFFLLAQAWPALLIAGYGVWHQCRTLTPPSQPTV